MATSSPDTWHRRIDDWMTKYREREARHDLARQYYYNRFPGGLVTVNLIFSYGRAMVPQLYFKNPSVTVQIKGDRAPLSRLLQETDVELIRQMNLKRTIKKMIVSTYLTGRGVGKLGFSTDDLPVFDPSALIKPNQPWFLHVLTKNWAHALPTNGDIDDVPWAAMRVAMTADEIRRRIDRPPDSLARAVDALPEDNPDETIELWEVYDRGAGERGLLYENEWAIEPQPFAVWPFYLIEFNWVPEEPIPISDAELILHIQQEYNENETQIHEHRRIAVTKLLLRKGVLPPEQRQALNSGSPGVIAELDTNSPIAEVVSELTPGIPDSLVAAKKILQDDARDVIGFSRNQIGELQGSASSRRTFGEAAIVQQALQIRLDERRDMVADLIEQVVRAANQLIFKRWTAEDARRYAGILDSAAWGDLSQIQADDYTITVIPDSTLPLSRALQRQQGLALYQAFKGDPLIDQVELRRKLLETFEGVDPDKLLNQTAVQAFRTLQQRMDPAAVLQSLQAAQGQQGRMGVPQPRARQAFAAGNGGRQ